MTAVSTGVEATDSSVTDALAALGNGTRLQALHILWEAHDPVSGDSSLTFSELFERVDYDTPANFSYHLDQLQAAGFVGEAETGYTLAFPGQMVIRSIAAGWAANDPVIEPVPINTDCPECGSQAYMSYKSGVMRAHCQHCSEIDLEIGSVEEAFNISCLGLPPAGLDGRSPHDIFRAAVSYQYHRVKTHLDGVCPSCASPIRPTIHLCENHDASEGACGACGRASRAGVRAVCGNCKSYALIRVARAVQSHPTVTAFYESHGVHHRFATWEAARRAREYKEELLSNDPIRIQVSIPCRDDQLHLTVDGELSVVNETREEVAVA